MQASYQLRIESWRARLDNAGLNASGFTYAAGEVWTQRIGTKIRLRAVLHNYSAEAFSSALSLWINADGTERQVTSSSSSIGMKLVSSGYFSDGATTSQVLGLSGGAFVAGVGITSSTATPSVVLDPGEYTEIEWCLELTDTEVIRAKVGLESDVTLWIRVDDEHLYDFQWCADYDPPPPSLYPDDETCGVLQKTLGEIGLSAAGAVVVDGDLSRTLGVFGVGGSGTVEVVGGLNQTLGLIGLGASGGVSSISGSLIVTLDLISLEAAGWVEINGVMDQTLSGVAISGVGTVDIVGVCDSDDLGLVIRLVADGTTSGTPITGALILGLETVTLQAEGQVEVRGELEVTLAPIGLSTAALPVINGALNLVLSSMSLRAGDPQVIMGCCGCTTGIRLRMVCGFVYRSPIVGLITEEPRVRYRRVRMTRTCEDLVDREVWVWDSRDGKLHLDEAVNGGAGQRILEKGHELNPYYGNVPYGMHWALWLSGLSTIDSYTATYQRRVFTVFDWYAPPPGDYVLLGAEILELDDPQSTKAELYADMPNVVDFLDHPAIKAQEDGLIAAAHEIDPDYDPPLVETAAALLWDHALQTYQVDIGGGFFNTRPCPGAERDWYAGEGDGEDCTPITVPDWMVYQCYFEGAGYVNPDVTTSATMWESECKVMGLTQPYCKQVVSYNSDGIPCWEVWHPEDHVCNPTQHKKAQVSCDAGVAVPLNGEPIILQAPAWGYVKLESEELATARGSSWPAGNFTMFPFLCCGFDPEEWWAANCY